VKRLIPLFVLACGVPAAQTSLPERIETQGAIEEDSAPRIDDAASWQRLAAAPRNHHVAHTEVVKFAIDLTGGPRIYFIRSTRYESHYDFVRTRVDPDGYRDGMDFYRREYLSPDRRFILGSLVRYTDAEQYTFELISGDDLDSERIVWTFEQLRAHVFFANALRYRPTSDTHLARIAELGDRLPVADDAELYGALRYQPVQLGVAYGTLRLVRGPVLRGALGPRDLIVTNEVPDDLPLVAALITSRFQAPLAHVAVLSTNRGTPDMALRGAIDAPEIAALEGRLVRLEVGAQDFSLAPATMEQAQAHWQALAPHEPFTPRLNEARTEILDQCALDFGDVEVAGAKASNLGVLCRMNDAGIEVPPGFVIPFAHYVAHLRRSGLDRRIEEFLASDARRSDPTDALAELRSAIETAPMDPRLARDVQRRIRALSPGGRVRLRSSTNAEDLPGFNGAGLYSSEAIASDAALDAIASGVRRIWASVWNLGAFQEREHYRIDHARVAMAVLVQRSVDDAIGNGVAITANPYDGERPGVLINIQRTGASVTGARGDELPEQWLVFTYLPDREPELIARSTLTNGDAIMRREEVLELTRQLEVVHARFMPHFSDGSNAADVEFLIAGPARRPVLVQARPLRIAWQGREGAR
jgi:hypothetical protein